MIDGNVFGGSSGSLVFKIPPDIITDNGAIIVTNEIPKTYILGMVTLSFYDISTPGNSLQRLNIGAVISSEQIKAAIGLFN